MLNKTSRNCSKSGVIYQYSTITRSSNIIIYQYFQ